MLLANVSAKEADLQQQNIGNYVAYKRPSIVDNVLSVITRIWNFSGPSDTKYSGQSNPEPYQNGKEELFDKKAISVTCKMPIFETKKDGTGLLTVPLDYDSTTDDISMTPAGVYVEDMACSERNTSRPVALRKRRKPIVKGTHHAAAGGGESAKGGGKNRKDKKRNNLRMDIVNDSLALSIDDCYGYDYRDAEFEDALGSQCCLSSSFSPSSIGSVSSFHDAVQDALVMEACMQTGFGSAVPSASVPASPQPERAPRCSSSTTPAQTGVGNPHPGKPKCDIEPERSGFVVFSDFDVFTTPSASPAKRRTPRNLCKALSYVWHRQYSDESQLEDDEDDEEGKDGYSSSDDVTEDEFDHCRKGGVDYNDEDDDDDCVVFCDELDDNDDTNSSSGFEERKVRFNMKPAVHVMRTWDYAYRQARKGEWEMAARDRERFRKRIADLEPVLGPALQSALRDKIYTERFRNHQH